MGPDEQPSVSAEPLADEPTGVEPLEAQPSEPPPAAAPDSWFTQFRKFFFPTAKERGEQIARSMEDLNFMIAHFPSAPGNYVLRGELYLEVGANVEAAEDFRCALHLAAAQVESEDWGVIVQAMQDRAQAGLAQAERRLKQR